MIIQGTHRTGEIRDRADVIVIGTGAGGGTLADFLSERGWDVVMLEKGGFFRAEDFSQRENEAMADFNGRRGLDSTVDNAYFLNYAECVGGCTVHYWGDSFRAPADRLDVWRGLGIDWMTVADLAPHFDAIEEDLGIHICEERLFNENNRLVRQGCEELGVEGGAVPTARVDCIGCGWTQYGCAYNRKSSQLITTIPRVSIRGGRVYSDARADRLIVEGGRVRGVEGALLSRDTDEPRGTFRVDADLVVVAGGAIGSAEFLLRNVQDPTVGKRLYMNPHYFVYGDFGREIDNVTGIPCAYEVSQFRELHTDATGGYQGGGYTMLCNHQSPGVTAATLSEIGAAHRERIGKYRQLGSLMSVIDETNPGRIWVDDDGHRRSWHRVRGVDVHKAVDYMRNAARILLAAGAREVWIPDVWGTVVRAEDEVERNIGIRSVMPNAQFAAGSHFLGTAPIGADPQDSFADPNGESHRLRGLYVADGAAVPGSVSKDPSLTIMAVARRIAEGMHEREGAKGA
ncbi:MAG: GMC family oxidoreductase N-terminal domain-containing protein [Gemmatimonadota bacterium]